MVIHIHRQISLGIVVLWRDWRYATASATVLVQLVDNSLGDAQGRGYIHILEGGTVGVVACEILVRRNDEAVVH